MEFFLSRFVVVVDVSGKLGKKTSQRGIITRILRNYAAIQLFHTQIARCVVCYELVVVVEESDCKTTG